MTKLVNQPTKFPTRKLMAVIIAGMVIGGLQAGLGFIWPEESFTPLLEKLDIWVQAGVMMAAGYMTKEREE